MSEEWSDWFQHDGKGKPFPLGTFVHIVYACGREWVGISTGGVHSLGKSIYVGRRFASSWDWTEPGQKIPVARYRIRKPRGLTILENLIADLPAPTRKVDA